VKSQTIEAIALAAVGLRNWSVTAVFKDVLVAFSGYKGMLTKKFLLPYTKNTGCSYDSGS